MDLSVIIPARNEQLNLPHQLDALIDQECDREWEIIVVDNGSTDGTARVVEEYASRSPRVRYLLAIDTADQSYAANAGVAASNAPAVVFCDADDVVCDGWVQTMAEGLDDHPVVTGPNLVDRLNPPWLANSRGRSMENPVGTFFNIFPLVRGNNYGVRREVWAAVGPLSIGYFPVADQEFSLRCWLHGIDIVGLPEAKVHYRYRSNPRALWRQGFAYGSGRPKIARVLKDLGKPTPPKFAGWRSWILLVMQMPTIVFPTRRAVWLWIAGNRFGQVAGSIRERIIML